MFCRAELRVKIWLFALRFRINKSEDPDLNVLFICILATYFADAKISFWKLLHDHRIEEGSAPHVRAKRRDSPVLNKRKGRADLRDKCKAEF